jgi:hypothetical protein
MAFLALLAILLGLPMLTSASPGGSPSRATLEVVNTAPLTVTGHGFKPRETVRVSASKLATTVRAGARGGFQVVFRRASACNGVVVFARGSMGSRASVSFANVASVHCLEPLGKGSHRLPPPP